MIRLASITLVLLAGLSQSSLAQQPLESRLMPLISEHQGEVAVAVKHLTTGESFRHRDDVPQPTASLIKFPVMIEAYRQSVQDKLDLGKHVVLREEDKVPGSGVLTEHFSAGASISLRDCIRLMIAYSDNTATNLVLDQIGIGATAATMEELGYPHTKIHSKVFNRSSSVFPDRSLQFGLGSTTAAEMVCLLEALHKEELVTAAASREMLVHLKKCQDKQKFPRLLPSGTVVAFKTGSVDATRTAAGIVYTKSGPIALCVLTCKNKDQRWTTENAGDLLCAKIAREVYDHWNPITLSPKKPIGK